MKEKKQLWRLTGTNISSRSTPLTPSLVNTVSFYLAHPIIICWYGMTGRDCQRVIETISIKVHPEHISLPVQHVSCPSLWILSHSARLILLSLVNTISFYLAHPISICWYGMTGRGCQCVIRTNPISARPKRSTWEPAHNPVLSAHLSPWLGTKNKK